MDLVVSVENSAKVVHAVGMPRRVTDFRGLAEPSRLRLLGCVQRQPGLTVVELADLVGLHVNTTRDHLDALVREGLLAARPLATGKRGRPRLLYACVDDANENEAARDRIARAQTTRELLHKFATGPKATPECELGDAAELQLETVYEHLQDSGLQPDLDRERLVFDIVPCPFFTIVDEEPELACAVHERLLKDTLAQVPGPIKSLTLQPFVGPHDCRVSLFQRQETDRINGLGNAVEKVAE